MKKFWRNEKKDVWNKIRDKHMNWYRSNPLKERSTQYAEYYNAEIVKDNIVLYEAFFGRGILCNSNGLFQGFIKRDDFDKYEHIWVIEDFEINKTILEEYSIHKNIKFVEYLSNEYLYYLACAKILINNVTFPSFFTKKEEQIYINTWHGIPIKTLGYDQENGNLEVANTIRNLFFTDYLISPCGYQTQIYKKAFKLEGIFQGKIIEEGQPRNDLLISGNREKIIEKMRRCGVEIFSDKKIILYAPTWKGKKYAAPTVDIDGYFNFIDTIEARLGDGEYQVLVKPHQVVYKHIKEDKRMNGKFVPAILDANEVLAVTDILVSDYSSIYFDFMLTDKPIFFYIPDIDEYKDYRGLYLPLEDLPGPATKEMEQLADWVLSSADVEKKFKNQYEKQKRKFTANDDGRVSKKIWNIVLDNKENYKITEGLLNEKKKILAYLGATKVNGITESFNSLLSLLDYEKFDITVIAMPASNPEILERLCAINPNARVLTRVGQYNATIDEAVNNEMVMEYSLDDSDIKKYYSDDFYYKEYRRNFGDAKFDYLVNFTGYSAFYTILLLQAKEAKKFIWLHNDLMKDKNRIVNGEKINEKPLGTVFSAYPHYDKLVSCSESVMYVNRDSIATEQTYNKYTYCRNLVNFERVLSGMSEEKELLWDEKKYLVKSNADCCENTVLSLEAVPFPEQDNINFVTMGRMSPEKNHVNLIRAFARFNREIPRSKLYILGDGPLMDVLQGLIHEECCTQSVILLGNISNPFMFMKHCDCFILPSHYEGQPMVILEARAMGLPIIVADFSTVADSLLEKGQLLIRQDIESIYQGLISFAEGKVPYTQFDYNEYNKSSYREFERLFENESREAKN